MDPAWPFGERQHNEEWSGIDEPAIGEGSHRFDMSPVPVTLGVAPHIAAEWKV
jgi:hypothetical protein